MMLDISDRHILAIDEEVLEVIKEPARIMAPVRYPGGKGNLVRQIKGLFPNPKIYSCYVEPFCGAASVFWHCGTNYKNKVLNDLDGSIINLFRVLQNPEQFKKLFHRLVWTPYSQAEFERALEILTDASPDTIDLAWATFVAKNQGFGGIHTSAGNWSRTLGPGANTTQNYVPRKKLLVWWHRHLQDVQITQTDALECIKYWDTPQTFFYIDPPYVHETRIDKQMYNHECDNAYHEQLVQTLLQIKGAVILSGYESPIYDPLIKNQWNLIKIQTACYQVSKARGSKTKGSGNALKHAPRTECLYISPNVRDHGKLY